VVDIFLVSMALLCPVRNQRSTPGSIPASPWCFEGSLIVFYSGVCIFLGDEHLPGMLPACKHLYFLEHLQNNNWWFSGRLNPTVILSCFLWIDCLLNVWDQMTDQLNNLLSNVTRSLCFESSLNPILELGSATCSSGSRGFLNDFLQISFVLAGLNLPVYAKFLRYCAYYFFRKISLWC